MIPDVQRPAAVVSPLTVYCLVTIIVPAPMKPSPETTCAPSLDISAGTFASRYRYIPVMAAMLAASATRIWVLNPADLFLYDLSIPMIPPQSAAKNILQNTDEKLTALIPSKIDIMCFSSL